MSALFRTWLLRGLSAAYRILAPIIVFSRPAQATHDSLLRWLRILDNAPFCVRIAAALHRLTAVESETEVGGARLSRRLILAAGLVKGNGFADEDEALLAVKEGRKLIPGWRIVPALLGPVEFGSFTRHPRIGNQGRVVWRHESTRSTQNRVGLRNPGARAAARFLGGHRSELPKEFGINIAVSPGVDEIEEQTRDVVESLAFFLDADLRPTWFTLNLSCPNTEDDPQGYQIEAETRQLCGAFIKSLRARELDIPLWVKLSPGLADEQVSALMRVFHEVGVKAVIATNTLPKPSPDDDRVQAGVGGGDLYPEALKAVRQLIGEKIRQGYAVDVIACGGILDGDSMREYEGIGVKAGQYWSALVYRGPFAAAIIESELARHDYEYEAIQRESLA
ncbi:MAG: hypothetical protein OXN88_08035 [Chloroflexota bacterium]|nr:hypothetical protein [Chloroflexota bacterium]